MAKEMKKAEHTHVPAHETKVETAAPAEKAAPAITSENLTKLRGEEEAAAVAMQSAKYNSPEWIDAKTKLWQLESQIKTEEAKIKSDIKTAELQEQRNARVKMADDLVAKVQSGEDFTAELETVKNELLARYATSTPSKKVSGTSNGTGTKGATSTAIRDLIVPMYAGAIKETVSEIGKNVRKEIIGVHGFNDGTANGVILAYEKELGLK